VENGSFHEGTILGRLRAGSGKVLNEKPGRFGRAWIRTGRNQKTMRITNGFLFCFGNRKQILVAFGCNCPQSQKRCHPLRDAHGMSGVHTNVQYKLPRVPCRPELHVGSPSLQSQHSTAYGYVSMQKDCDARAYSDISMCCGTHHAVPCLGLAGKTICSPTFNVPDVDSRTTCHDPGA
jgi:hypothetical protein